jgi:membrane protein DedA with SNARE-associated domain
MPDLLMQHGAAVVFVRAFAVQAGVPAPAVPMLLGAGILSGSGQMHLALAIAAAMAATRGADVLPALADQAATIAAGNGENTG